jgi:hypothetical protein
MKYAVKMGSGAMIYILSFIKIVAGIQTLIGGNSQAHRQQGDRISLLLFFQNKESRLKKVIVKAFRGPISSLVSRLCVSGAMNNVEVALFVKGAAVARSVPSSERVGPPVSTRILEPLWV